MIATWNLPVVKLSITVFILIKWQSWLFERFYLLGLTKPRETHILICARFLANSIELLLFPIFNANISLKKGYLYLPQVGDAYKVFPIIYRWIKGCLPFTVANRSVDGLGKWYAKFRTAKFRAGIAFTICTYPFHLLRNDHEGLKLVLKKALKQWNTNFCLEYSIRKNRLPFQLFRCSRKFSAATTQEVVFHLLFNRVLRKRFDMVNNR